MEKRKIELLAPAGSMANLKAAVSKGADAVYLGMRDFSARSFATNFDYKGLKQAVDICKSNNVKLSLTMNTLVRNDELKSFFGQLSSAYSCGIDAVILQEISLIDMIKKNYPDLRVHVSTQAGAMNSGNMDLLTNADRVTLARELTSNEIRRIRPKVRNEMEVFCHGALCVSISGQCLFSSLLGGRSGNRGRCAQPCRKNYDGTYYLSTRELCLINEIPDLISAGADSLKIEGRMRTPSYVATTTSIYRKSIDSYYDGRFNVDKGDIGKLNKIFTREFTKGWFSSSEDMINTKSSSAKTHSLGEHYEVKSDNFNCTRQRFDIKMPYFKDNLCSRKELLVRVYNKHDAITAAESGADVIYLDILDKDFTEIKESVKCKMFGVIPRMVFEDEISSMLERVEAVRPDGVLLGNLGLLKRLKEITIHLDYNANIFNDHDISFMKSKRIMPLLSPELSIRDLKSIKNKDCGLFVHGKIRLMTLRHKLKEGIISDQKGSFIVNHVHNGSEIINGKELGLLSKAQELLKIGFSRFYVDTEKDIGKVVKIYRDILSGKRIDDKDIKKRYVLGWSYKGVM